MPLDPTTLTHLIDAAELAHAYQRDHDDAAAEYTEASRERTAAIHAVHTITAAWVTRVPGVPGGVVVGSIAFTIHRPTCQQGRGSGVLGCGRSRRSARTSAVVDREHGPRASGSGVRFVRVDSPEGGKEPNAHAVPPRDAGADREQADGRVAVNLWRCLTKGYEAAEYDDEGVVDGPPAYVAPAPAEPAPDEITTLRTRVSELEAALDRALDLIEATVTGPGTEALVARLRVALADPK